MKLPNKPVVATADNTRDWETIAQERLKTDGPARFIRARISTVGAAPKIL